MGKGSHSTIDTFTVARSSIVTEALQFIVENMNCIRKCFIALMLHLNRFWKKITNRTVIN